MMIKSLRLGYKRISYEAYDFLREYFSREDTTRYLPFARPFSDDEVRTFIDKSIDHWQENGFGLYLLYRRSYDDCIGYCGLEYVEEGYVDLRYGVKVRHWGKGFATEAARTCLNYGFSHLELPVIYGAAVPQNIASIAILKKIGMKETEDVGFYGSKVKYFKMTKAELGISDI